MLVDGSPIVVKILKGLQGILLHMFVWVNVIPIYHSLGLFSLLFHTSLSAMLAFLLSVTFMAKCLLTMWYAQPFSGLSKMVAIEDLSLPLVIACDKKSVTWFLDYCN